ncbi:NAD(P)-dependent oxidoreductase [Streptococcus thoraltensis]|uniref:NAD(P)-dependent oxidoreductase n=1 Tax=Streptococcus thoraltensis TaxID=55085 RepID=UPI0003640F5A|nr:NAD(P)-dependent oxidoreductase [Streptococcus thoraltensis]MDY4762302.1 NAD(P)-dependent oxidoreductase [Streptococcus thoraltensis]
MNKAKIVILGQPLEEGLSELKELFQVDQAPLENTRDWLLEHLSEYDGLYTTQLPVDKEMIDAGTNLKIISTHSVGFDHIDIDYAKEKGIVVANSPEAVMVPTAELAVSLMLASMRQVAFLDRRLRDGEWVNTSLPAGLSQGLSGKTVGIFGFGRIGQEVAKMVQAFGAKVIYNKRNPLSKAKEEALQVSYRDFADLLAEADVISLHAPATDETKGLFNAEIFNKMKTGVFLINTARGSLVDEEAMIAALKSGKLSGAGLDVYEVEGQSHPELTKLENVVMTPHSGSATWDARIKLSREAAQNIISYLDEGKIINQVNV